MRHERQHVVEQHPPHCLTNRLAFAESEPSAHPTHTSPYVSIRQHVSIRYAYATHTSDLLAFAEGELTDAHLNRAFIPQ